MIFREHVLQIHQWMGNTTPAEWTTIMGDLFAQFLAHPRGAERRADISETAGFSLNEARAHVRVAREEILEGGR